MKINIKPKARYLYIETDIQSQYVFLSDKKWPGYKKLTKEELDNDCCVSDNVHKINRYVLDLSKLIEGEIVK